MNKEEVTIGKEAFIRIAFSEDEMKIIRNLAEKEGITPDELAFKAIIRMLKKSGYEDELKKRGFI